MNPIAQVVVHRPEVGRRGRVFDQRLQAQAVELVEHAGRHDQELVRAADEVGADRKDEAISGNLTVRRTTGAVVPGTRRTPIFFNKIFFNKK